MSREWQAYLADIRTACEKVAKFTAGMDRNTFFGDDRTYHAVVHCLLIVGEAAKRIPGDVRQRMPDIEWRKIAGMRDWMAHAYFAINSDILWDVVENKVPALEQALRNFEDDDRPLAPASPVDEQQVTPASEASRAGGPPEVPDQGPAG